MAIEFHTIPEECHAQIFFVDGGYTGEDWEAEIEATGEILCLIEPKVTDIQRQNNWRR